ncbi:glycosyltransferase [Amycolatopsis decaplanina]|uniref:Uncharacterized protein n=1 Tax=Amycolatopsis decaplanina DSM 44594 TaxID=1284240 RepID=M2YRZ3_9PSEU|nr:nucleotide disphospho-sugar-binding domain-containing protein [Amycolatopsis decaplanina]EME57632.1 hypothetical protein H074_20617 [Amycolatopsis decaplanina DSM 44594]
MRVLFSTAPLYGHFFPLVPFAWAWRSAGHEVLVSTTRDFADTVISAGLPPVVTATDIGRDDYARSAVRSSTLSDVDTAIRASGRGWGELAGRMIGNMIEAVDRCEPDLVISEPCEFAGRIAATQAGIPWIKHNWGLAVSPLFDIGAEERLPEYRAVEGLAPAQPPAEVIYTCPASVQHPGVSDGLTMRYLPYSGTAILPDWVLSVPRKPRACVTFGSLLPRYGGTGPRRLIPELIDELRELGMEVVLAVDERNLGSYETSQAGVLHAGWLPLDQVLPRCDLVVHHGGSGTAMTASTCGVPQLILPQATDQFGTADRLAARGVALRLAPDETSGTAVRDALRTLIFEPAFAAEARTLADEYARLVDPASVVNTLARRITDRAETSRCDH